MTYSELDAILVGVSSGTLTACEAAGQLSGVVKEFLARRPTGPQRGSDTLHAAALADEVLLRFLRRWPSTTKPGVSMRSMFFQSVILAARDIRRKHYRRQRPMRASDMVQQGTEAAPFAGDDQKPGGSGPDPSSEVHARLIEQKLSLSMEWLAETDPVTYEVVVLRRVIGLSVAEAVVSRLSVGCRMRDLRSVPSRAAPSLAIAA